jgi:hypothetical protein
MKHDDVAHELAKAYAQYVHDTRRAAAKTLRQLADAVEREENEKCAEKGVDVRKHTA